MAKWNQGLEPGSLRRVPNLEPAGSAACALGPEALEATEDRGEGHGAEAAGAAKGALENRGEIGLFELVLQRPRRVGRIRGEGFGAREGDDRKPRRELARPVDEDASAHVREGEIEEQEIDPLGLDPASGTRSATNSTRIRSPSRLAAIAADASFGYSVPVLMRCS